MSDHLSPFLKVDMMNLPCMAVSIQNGSFLGRCQSKRMDTKKHWHYEYLSVIFNVHHTKKFNDCDEIHRNLPEVRPEGFSQVCWCVDSDAVQGSVWVWSPSQESGDGAFRQWRTLNLKPIPHEHDEGSVSIQSPQSDHTAVGVRTGKGFVSIF